MRAGRRSFRQQLRLAAGGSRQGRGLAIESQQRRAAEPTALEDNDAVGEVAARFEPCEAGLDRRPFGLDLVAGEQSADRRCDLLSAVAVAACENRDEFAQNRQRHDHLIGLLESHAGHLGFLRIVIDGGADQDVRIGDRFHRSLAQPSAASSAISSSVSGRAPGRSRQPKKSSMVPEGFAARISARPSGSSSTATFSPGLTPICSSNSLRRVTCPLAVTVSFVTSVSIVKEKVRHFILTCKTCGGSRLTTAGLPAISRARAKPSSKSAAPALRNR